MTDTNSPKPSYAVPGNVLSPNDFQRLASYIGLFASGDMRLPDFSRRLIYTVMRITGAEHTLLIEGDQTQLELSGGRLLTNPERNYYLELVRSLTPGQCHTSLSDGNETIFHALGREGSRTLVLVRNMGAADEFQQRFRWPELYKTDPSMVPEQDIEGLEFLVELLSMCVVAMKAMSIPREWLALSLSNPSRLTVPWEAREQLTLTLSLDIRSSTFMMENNISSRRYALWLLSLTSALREVANNRAGFFDKFTGDGVLTHFLPSNGIDDVPSDGDIRATAETALSCALEMLDVFDAFLGFVQNNQHYKNPKIGVSVGLALGEASWQRHEGVLMVVGRGVVLACRASSGEAGFAYMSNAVASYLKGSAQDLIPCTFSSKEIRKDEDISIWRIPQSTAYTRRSTRELGEIAKRHWETTLQDESTPRIS